MVAQALPAMRATGARAWGLPQQPDGGRGRPVGVLDWELAHLGDDGGPGVAVRQLGASVAAIAGGADSCARVFEGYAAAGGLVDAERVRHWEVMGTLSGASSARRWRMRGSAVTGDVEKNHRPTRLGGRDRSAGVGAAHARALMQDRPTPMNARGRGRVPAEQVVPASAGSFMRAWRNAPTSRAAADGAGAGRPHARRQRWCNCMASSRAMTMQRTACWRAHRQRRVDLVRRPGGVLWQHARRCVDQPSYETMCSLRGPTGLTMDFDLPAD
jgi:aminoglycoside phosphotransferase (APT) family kinase protein